MCDKKQLFLLVLLLVQMIQSTKISVRRNIAHGGIHIRRSGKREMTVISLIVIYVLLLSFGNRSGRNYECVMDGLLPPSTATSTTHIHGQQPSAPQRLEHVVFMRQLYAHIHNRIQEPSEFYCDRACKRVRFA